MKYAVSRASPIK